MKRTNFLSIFKLQNAASTLPANLLHIGGGGNM